MTDHNSETKTKKVSRRSFLSALSVAGLGISGLAGLFANLRYLKPTVDYGMDKVFRVGKVEDYKEGTHLALEKERVAIIHDKRGFAAISLVCTHLGCTVRASANGFECPCHGSSFDDKGLNTGGPAPRPLDWYQISLAPNGDLEVDKSVVLPAETFFKA